MMLTLSIFSYAESTNSQKYNKDIKPNINKPIIDKLPVKPDWDKLPALPSDLPEIPTLPTELERVEESGEVRKLEKNFTVMVEAKLNLFVPLEIVSDIDLSATVFGDQVVEVPFEIELNREPERKNFYRLHYSEKEIDIDGDGKIDTFIYSPEFANARYIKDNYVQIHGANITKEGDYERKVYITVEAGIEGATTLPATRPDLSDRPTTLPVSRPVPTERGGAR